MSLISKRPFRAQWITLASVAFFGSVAWVSVRANVPPPPPPPPSAPSATNPTQEAIAFCGSHFPSRSKAIPEKEDASPAKACLFGSMNTYYTSVVCKIEQLKYRAGEGGDCMDRKSKEACEARFFSNASSDKLTKFRYLRMQQRAELALACYAGAMQALGR